MPDGTKVTILQIACCQIGTSGVCVGAAQASSALTGGCWVSDDPVD